MSAFRFRTTNSQSKSRLNIKKKKKEQVLLRLEERRKAKKKSLGHRGTVLDAYAHLTETIAQKGSKIERSWTLQGREGTRAG